MKKMNWIAMILVLLIVITGCKKNDSGSTLPDDVKPVPTPVGTTVGAAVTKNIGTAGGTVSSADGKAELIFPAGALTANTDISIQAITNNTPNGTGNAYRLLPDGIKFLKPVTLKVYYTSADLSKTLPDLIGMAFQDSTKAWRRIKSFTNDITNKAISASITHFSDWSMFDVAQITPPQATLKVSESVDLFISFVETGKDDDELTPLIPSTKKITWSANGVTNGNATEGTITSAGGTKVTYKAPGKAPAKNPVAISAEIDASFTFQGKKFNNIRLVANINIGEEYILELVDKSDILGYGLWVTDTASMKVTIAGDKVEISEIKNDNPVSNPSNFTTNGCTFSYVPGGVGKINITTATGEMRIQSATQRAIQFFFKHTGTRGPVYRQLCPMPSGPPFDVTLQQDLFDGYPISLFFDLTGGIVYDNDLPLPGHSFTAKLSPVK